MYYNARWLRSVPEAQRKGYDPGLGRFAQADTIIPLESQGVQAWDRYAYANNNAVRYNDPSGHWAIPVGLVIAAVVILKVIDYGWTAYDAGSALITAANANNSPEIRKEALANAAVAVGMELIEPDDISPVALPLDDLVRHGDDIGEFIYRKASGSTDSLTPRPGVDDLNLENGGLSFFDSVENMVNNMPFKPGDKYVVVDPKKLDGLDVIFDNTPPGHVSVRPPTLNALKEWASTWKTETIHGCTEIIKDAIVGKPVKWR